jgi:hypothetical protein
MNPMATGYVSPMAYGYVDGHLVAWQVRHITWCTVCGTRESTCEGGLCVRCETDARLLVESVFVSTGPAGQRRADGQEQR